MRYIMLKHLKLLPLIMILPIIVNAKTPPLFGKIITGSNEVVKIEKEYSNFDKIEISNAFKSNITFSKDYSIEISINENFVKHLNVIKRGRTLRIFLDPQYSYKRMDNRVDITLPHLEELRLSGASQADVEGFDHDNQFVLHLSGASKVNGSLNTGDLKIRLSGASSIDFKGKGKHLDINASGASTIRLMDFEVDNADIDISGATTAKVFVNDKLEISMSGASKIRYSGNCVIESINSSGASSVKRL